MVEIFTKRDGPRREDVAARRLIDQNRGTIERLANHLSGGDYRARLKPPPAPKASGFILHDMSGGARTDEPARPYVRISLNDRVVLVDGDTGKQLHHLGEMRDMEDGRRMFVLATRENGFHFPLDEDVCRKLAGIDRKTVPDTECEEDLAAEIGERLGLD